MRIINLYLGWFFVAVGAICLPADPIVGLIIMLWGVLLLPFVNRSIEDLGWQLNGWKRLGIVLASFMILVAVTPSDSSSSEPTPPISASDPSPVAASPAPQSSPTNSVPSPLTSPLYVRPERAENGSPFPSTSDYISGYPVELVGGSSTVTIDNSRNDSDVVAKLFSLESNPPKAARVFFIRAGEKFTLNEVPSGTYDIRHQDLDSGAIAKTEPLEIEEQIALTLTLFKVADGNLESYPVSPDEF